MDDWVLNMTFVDYLTVNFQVIRWIKQKKLYLLISDSVG